MQGAWLERDGRQRTQVRARVHDNGEGDSPEGGEGCERTGGEASRGGQNRDPRNNDGGGPGGTPFNTGNTYTHIPPHTV